MARGKRANIDLNKIKRFTYTLQLAPEKLRNELTITMQKWAADTKAAYDSKTGYPNGFQHIKGKSFYTVQEATSFNGIYVSVGHEAYIARFLEVGTKAHAIPHRKSKPPYVVHVSGIKGSKALSDAWNSRKKNAIESIEKAVTSVIKGG